MPDWPAAGAWAIINIAIALVVPIAAKTDGFKRARGQSPKKGDIIGDGALFWYSFAQLLALSYSGARLALVEPLRVTNVHFMALAAVILPLAWVAFDQFRLGQIDRYRTDDADGAKRAMGSWRMTAVVMVVVIGFRVGYGIW
jgi:hypothetical protein